MTNGEKGTALYSVREMLRDVNNLVMDLAYTSQSAKKMIFKKTSNEGLVVDKRWTFTMLKITFETKENGETVVTEYFHNGITIDDEHNTLVKLFNEEPQIGKEVEAILNHYYNIYQMSKNGLLEDDDE